MRAGVASCVRRRRIRPQSRLREAWREIYDDPFMQGAYGGDVLDADRSGIGRLAHGLQHRRSDLLPQARA
jgi:hypothetical protein